MVARKVIELVRTEQVCMSPSYLKKEGQIWFCVQYRELNEVKVHDSYFHTNGRVYDYLRRRVFSTLEAICGFWKITVGNIDCDQMASVFHVGLFNFKRFRLDLMTILKHSSKTCTSFFSKATKRLVNLDDAVVFGTEPAKATNHVRSIFTLLGDADILFKLRSMTFS